MIETRRLLAVGTVLSLAILAAVSHVWSEPRRDDDRLRRDWHGSSDARAGKQDDRRFGEDLKVSRFADRPLVLYRTTKGETLWAYQLKAKIDAEPYKACDYLVLVDTSASKAKGPLAQEQKIVRQLIARMGRDDRVERALQNADIRGALVKRNQAEDLSARAAAANRRDTMATEKLNQDQVRERMRVFHNLMDQAREQEAYRQAQAIRMDQINKGLPVPPAVTAGYQVGLSGYHLREERELRRIREERWLATLLQVEKSHVPFPDEPPVEFPPPAVWKALADLRKARYESTTFGGEIPKRAYELQSALSKTVTFKGFDDPKTTLGEALDALAKQYNLTFDVNEKAFKFENVMDVLKTEIASPNPVPEIRATLATVLRKVLQALRDLSDPEVTGVDTSGLRGGLAAQGRPVRSPVTPRRAVSQFQTDKQLYAARVRSLVANSVGVMAQATLSADRRWARVSLTLVFAGAPGGAPVVNNPLIPGAHTP